MVGTAFRGRMHTMNCSRSGTHGSPKAQPVASAARGPNEPVQPTESTQRWLSELEMHISKVVVPIATNKGWLGSSGHSRRR